MRSVVLIPARYNSSRYPGKPLVPLLGKPMILWVVELSAVAVGIDNVYVVTDDNRIADVVKEAGYQVIMTVSPALTGTDRLAEAVDHVAADIYINVQGDEPLANPDDILKVLETKVLHPEDVVNGYCWLSDNEDPKNVNIPKVISNENNELIYMSRLAVPGFKESTNAPMRYKKQVCIYAFSKEELQAFKLFGRKSELEQCEDIEILRFLEIGKRIRMVQTQPGSLAVDIPEDVKLVEEALKKRVKS